MSKGKRVICCHVCGHIQQNGVHIVHEPETGRPACESCIAERKTRCTVCECALVVPQSDYKCVGAYTCSPCFEAMENFLDDSFACVHCGKYDFDEPGECKKYIRSSPAVGDWLCAYGDEGDAVEESASVSNIRENENLERGI